MCVLVLTSVTPTLSHEIFMFQRFGLADRASILEYLGEDLSKWASLEFSLERHTGEQWYNTPATFLGQLVWKTSFDSAVKIAIASLDRDSLGLEEYVAKCENTKGNVEQTFRDRAYKMLTIANPNNGNAFFQLIFNYDLSKKGMVALTKENLYTLAMSCVQAKGKTEVLHMLMTGNAKDDATIEMFGDSKKTLLHMRKEFYWEELIDETETIVQWLSIYDGVPADGFGKWVKEQLTMHVQWSFHEVWKDLSKSGSNNSLVKVMDEEGEVKDWANVSSKDTMYPKAWVERGVSEWEIERCP
ncbi:hypothetical protein GOP47_0011093 [Adiantum capillus-veneris]|uniref:Uncharacterized protein n=1 Tax=Adiantum capillus-veneris TaxID=13818 RepID=A0A9D4US55_ADICA|nr:hypothetical protein GOP47_0011093 [Adiantum capillus-veneris]